MPLASSRRIPQPKRLMATPREHIQNATEAVKSSVTEQKDSAASSLGNLAGALRKAAHESGDGDAPTTHIVEWAADGLERVSAAPAQQRPRWLGAPGPVLRPQPAGGVVLRRRRSRVSRNAVPEGRSRRAQPAERPSPIQRTFLKVCPQEHFPRSFVCRRPQSQPTPAATR